MSLVWIWYPGTGDFQQWCFDKCRLRRACEASFNFKPRNSKWNQSVARYIHRIFKWLAKAPIRLVAHATLLEISCCGSFGILGQVWHLIVSNPDPCCLSYFKGLTLSWGYLTFFMLNSIEHEKATCIKGQFALPPYETKHESCFSPISSYCYIKTIAQVSVTVWC